MNTTWCKVWRDLAHNKARTALVVLSTAVGVFALGLVFGVSDVMPARMTQAQRETQVAHITFSGGPFTQEAVDAIGREPGVRDTQWELWTSLRWKPVSEEEWRDANLIVRAEYDAQRMEFLRLLDGRWPEGRVLGVERMAASEETRQTRSVSRCSAARRSSRASALGAQRTSSGPRSSSGPVPSNTTIPRAPFMATKLASRSRSSATSSKSPACRRLNPSKR